MAALAAAPMSASFEESRSIGGSYQYKGGFHLGSLTSHDFGFINDAPVGYFVGINAGFGDLVDGVVQGKPPRREQADELREWVESLGL